MMPIFLWIGLAFVLALSAAFSAVASVFMLRFAKGLAKRRRQWLAALIGPLVTLSPAYVGIAMAGDEAIVSLLSLVLFSAVIALVAGLPAVLLVEPRPRQG